MAIKIDINDEKLKRKFLSMLEDDTQFREAVIKILIDKQMVTKTYLDVQLAKLAKSFDEKMEAQTKAFDRKLEEQTKAFDKKLEEQTKAFDRKLEELTIKFDKKLEEQTKAFDRKLEELTIKFDRKLEEQAKAFDRKLEEQTKAFDKKLEEQAKAFDRKLEEMAKMLTKNFEDRLIALEKRFDDKLIAFEKRFDDKLLTLGGRWGKDAESAFREGLKDIIGKEFGGKVEHWYYKGKIPQVHPRREEYEVDIVVSNKKLVVLEIKGSVSSADVEKFYDNVRAYEIIENKKVDRKVIVTPLSFKEVRSVAKRLGIEIISPPREYYMPK